MQNPARQQFVVTWLLAFILGAAVPCLLVTCKSTGPAAPQGAGQGAAQSLAQGAPAPPAGAANAPNEAATAAAYAGSAAFECRWTDGAITIDGKADEPAWRAAQVIEHFAMPWLGARAAPPRTATRARLLWDRQYLYFFAEMDDSDLFADVTEHDGKTWDNDVFELFFKPAGDKPGYYEFQVNPANTTMDMFLPSRGSGGYERYKSADPFEFKSAVQLRGTLKERKDTDKGWSVEGRLRWRDWMHTGGRPAVDEQWTFALCRYDYSFSFEAPQLSTCAPLTKRDFHHYEDYASLRFVGPIASTASTPYGIDHRPLWTTSRVVGSPDPPLPYHVQRVYPNLKLAAPINIAREPGTDNLIVIDQLRTWTGAGRVMRIKDDPGVVDPQVLLTLDDIAYGVAFHPNYATNGYLYVGSNGPVTGGAKKKTRVCRYTVGREAPFAIDPASKKLIIEWDSDGHNGGDLGFGRDGMLYVTAGDGTSDSDRNLTGQDLTRIPGSVIRIDVDHPAPQSSYAVPGDNPFIDVPGARPEIWAYGLRNPWRLTVDEKTGRIWVGSNGQDLWEHAFLIQRGANYGWSVMEGSHPFYLNRKRGPTPFTGPTIEHPHSEARSLTGGVVYYGAKLPELNGTYIYGDWSTGRIWAVGHDGAKVTRHDELARSTLQITGFGVSPAGELLITDHGGGAADGGGIYRLAPTPKGQPQPRFPALLSQTGLFTSVKGHRPDPALIPYDVNAPLWSDGATKERFIALPGDGHIDFTTSRGWNFTEGAVLVKTFSLDMIEGDSSTRRRIETRLLTKQQGQWVGYSYLWNDEQTDAALVAAAGVDRDYAIRDAAAPGGVRKQTWHYPSRSECMVCHSRAANFVLGLSLLQMNRPIDYGGVVDNQLRNLEHLGVLRVDWVGPARAAIKRDAVAAGMSEQKANQQVDRLTQSGGQRQPPASTLLTQAPDEYAKLVNPSDVGADLTARVRSYLHANCAQCHVEAGGGNALMELEFTTAPDKTNIIDVPPLHDSFGIEGARLIAPASPEHSILLQRLSRRGPGQMPPLATFRVDEQAVHMLRDWIAQMKPAAASASQ